MAVWSMGAMWITGLGFWTPLNLIAHTFYRSAPTNGTFSAPALLIGLAVHLSVASAFGTMIAVLAFRLPRSRALVVAVGVLFIAVVWPVMQWGVWYKLDENAAEGFTDWIFAIAHLVFAVTAAGVVYIDVADDDMSKRGRHAAGRSVAQAEPAPGSLFQPNRGQQGQNEPRGRYDGYGRGQVRVRIEEPSGQDERYDWYGQYQQYAQQTRALNQGRRL
jgi:hypothetical protein